jgi:hypothetical protein
MSPVTDTLYIKKALTLRQDFLKHNAIMQAPTGEDNGCYDRIQHMMGELAEKRFME